MKKGFTLIELLAVIVILAIIALIATPIILNIIEDSRDSAKQRSLELYKDAIANKIVTSQLTVNPVEPGNLSNSFLQTIDYDGERVSCTTNVLNTDGTIYLDGCSVGDSTKLYSYGKEVYVQIFKPTYYFYGDILGPMDFHNGATNPEITDASVIRSTYNKNYYTGYDWDEDNDEMTNLYVCIYMNNKEYCMMPYSFLQYTQSKWDEVNTTNMAIVRDAFKDNLDACEYYSNFSDNDGIYCQIDGYYMSSDPAFSFTGLNDTIYCGADSEGVWCFED